VDASNESSLQVSDLIRAEVINRHGMLICEILMFIVGSSLKNRPIYVLAASLSNAMNDRNCDA
jgi:hypothetical protein